MTWSHSSSVTSSAGRWMQVPALLMRTSTRPNRSTISPAARSMSARRATSPSNAAAVMPLAASSPTTSSFRAASLARMAMLAPASPRAWAKARPRPRFPPVTTATLPVSVNVSSTVMAGSSGFGTCVCPDGVVRWRHGRCGRSDQKTFMGSAPSACWVGEWSSPQASSSARTVSLSSTAWSGVSQSRSFMMSGAPWWSSL